MSDLKPLIEQILKEELTNLEYLHDGISTSTVAGKAWFDLVNALSTLIDEVKDFKDQYPSAVHGATPNTSGALIQLQMVEKIFVNVKPVVIGMDDIEKKDH